MLTEKYKQALAYINNNKNKTIYSNKEEILKDIKEYKINKMANVRLYCYMYTSLIYMREYPTYSGEKLCIYDEEKRKKIKEELEDIVFYSFYKTLNKMQENINFMIFKDLETVKKYIYINVKLNAQNDVNKTIKKIKGRKEIELTENIKREGGGEEKMIENITYNNYVKNWKDIIVEFTKTLEKEERTIFFMLISNKINLQELGNEIEFEVRFSIEEIARANRVSKATAYRHKRAIIEKFKAFLEEWRERN